jgi:hypothetical protein
LLAIVTQSPSPPHANNIIDYCAVKSAMSFSVVTRAQVQLAAAGFSKHFFKRHAAAGGGCSATSARYTPAADGQNRTAEIHVSDSEELEVYEEWIRTDGASSSD